MVTFLTLFRGTTIEITPILIFGIMTFETVSGWKLPKNYCLDLSIDINRMIIRIY